MQPPFARDPAVDQVGDAGVDEQTKGGKVVFVDNPIANHRGRDQAGEGEDVGKGVNVFVRGERGEEAGGEAPAGAKEVSRDSPSGKG